MTVVHLFFGSRILRPLGHTVCPREFTLYVLYFCVFKQWYGWQCLGFVTCTQILMHAATLVDYANTAGESSLIWCLAPSRLWCLAPSRLWCLAPSRLWCLALSRLWCLALSRLWCLAPSRLWCLAPSRLWCLAPALSVATPVHGKVGVFQLVSLCVFCVYQFA